MDIILVFETRVLGSSPSKTTKTTNLTAGCSLMNSRQVLEHRAREIDRFRTDLNDAVSVVLALLDEPFDRGC